jgi:signal transduction histidine kinase
LSGRGPVSGGKTDEQTSIGRDAVVRLHKVLETVMQDKTLDEVIGATKTALQATFGMRRLKFEAVSPSVKSMLKGTAPMERSGEADSLRLREGDRVSPNGFFTRAEDMLRHFGGEASEDAVAWREDDELRFVVRGRSGEPAAYVSVRGTESDRLPSMAEVECADLIVQLIGMAVHREQERSERDERSSNMVRRSDLLEDILRIASSVVSERDLTKVSDMVLSSLSSLFGFECVTLVTYDEGAAAFRWAALFGYPDTPAHKAKLRTIPTEVVLEDLRESRRIGKTAYHTPREDIPRRSLEYLVNPTESDLAPVQSSPRAPREFRQGDTLAFALHDSSGRVVGVIYVSNPKDGKIPDRETLDMIEVFTYLAEVAIENARLANDREQALRLNSLRMEQMSRIFDITSNVLYIRDLDELLQDVLKTLAQLLGIRRMVFGLKTDDGSIFKIRAVHGFTEERAAEVLKTEYPAESIDEIINPEKGRSTSAYVKWSRKVGSMTYYLPAESLKLEPWETVYYPEPELLRLPRKTKDHWHELDYMDTYIRNSEGDVAAYIEILKPRDDRIPDQETIEVIEIFANLVGIALENIRMVEGHIESRRSAEFFTDLLSHDIKNFNQAIMGYLDLVRAGTTRPEQVTYIEKVNEQVMNISRLAADVRTMSKLTFGGSKLAHVDVGKVLLDAASSVQQYYMSRNIVVHHELQVGRYQTMADELIRELFVNILTNAVKYDPNPQVEIDLTVDVRETKLGKKLVVSVADRGRGIPDELKQEVFERFNRAPKKKGTGLGLHIVKTLTSRYHGRVWVEDRVPGDHSKGAVFKVELPSAD